MRIAYLSTDEVNRDLVSRWADARDINLILRDREAIPADPLLDAVICDLDYLPPERREEVLASLLQGTLSCPSVVHGYNLDDSLSEALRGCGVLVTRRLTDHFLDCLYRIVCDLAPTHWERETVPVNEEETSSLAG